MRIKMVNDNKIFGLPLTILVKPNLISMVTFYADELRYYPLNAEGKCEENDLLSSTLLKFQIGRLTEYQDIGGIGNALRPLIGEIIQNINRAGCSIYDVTAFNVLYNNFSL